MPETLTGQIERVTFHNSDNGFAVLQVKLRGRQDLATVVGHLNDATAGEHLEATGQWVIDREHGPQFKAQDIRTAHPASAEGIERYLAGGAISGIGPKLAAKIVGIYKQRTLEIFGQHSDLLLHIHGIGTKRLQRIRESWQEQQEVRQIMLFLREQGVGTGRAIRIYRTYGQQAIATIKANPYQLADDIRGIGFKTADQIASKLGIEPNSPYRARAAVRYVLMELSQEGHCAYPETDLIQKTTELLNIDRQVVADAVEHGVTEGSVVRDRVDGQPWLYLAALHRAEVGLAEAIHRLAAGSNHPLPAIDLEKALAWVEKRLGLALAAAQQEAIRQACQHKVLVITGGPGVGKTTLVRSLLEIFEAKKLRAVLSAPTGRAAKRLAETTGRTAKTIHRLLEFNPATGDFLRNQKYPLTGDLFVVDETSMIDVVLGYQLLRAIPAGACVVLVGDVDQLPSVGPGSVLADLINSATVPVVRLTEIFRQAHQSRIVTAAYAINQGRMPELTSADGQTDFYWIEADEPEAVQDLIVRLVRDRIPARFGLDPKSEIQVLTPMNRSVLGTRNLNQVLQEALNPVKDGSEVQRFGWTFRVGDRALQTENNYQRDVYNGDLGIIEKINRIDQELTVAFEGRSVVYDFGDLDELMLSYALSIHKSQGSEYPCVVIPLHTQHYLMLQRNLLYTAVTRGKKLVVLVGAKKALGMAVRRQDTSRRYSDLRRRLVAGPDR